MKPTFALMLITSVGAKLTGEFQQTINRVLARKAESHNVLVKEVMLNDNMFDGPYNPENDINSLLHVYNLYSGHGFEIIRSKFRYDTTYTELTEENVNELTPEFEKLKMYPAYGCFIYISDGQLESMVRAGLIVANRTKTPLRVLCGHTPLTSREIRAIYTELEDDVAECRTRYRLPNIPRYR